jgi:serine protease Do
MGVLGELEQAASTVAAGVGPAVVRIGRGPGRGAGVVVGDGDHQTVAHNLRGDQVTVTFADGRVEQALVAGADVDGDLAVLRVDTGGVAPPEWGDQAGAGTPVFTVTNSASGGVRVSFGLVSNIGQAFRGPRGRPITGSLEHTAPLRRGSSGSPVVDRAGRLLGINTNRIDEGFYLALPADAGLRERIDALAAGQAPARRHLGVALAPPQAARHLRRAVGLPDRDGLLIRRVQEGSPADRAGLRQGDLIVAAGGRAVTTAEALYTALDTVEDEGSLDLRVVRGTEEIEVAVRFGEGARSEGSA